ncbi:MAG: TetR/AcrR family transcriptional regulator [Acidimicrobiales bacterium]|jgi:TetR/AcrR family transcriptional repressor of nem operon
MVRAPHADPGETDTATAILDIAEGLVQRRGFSGFSYADIAAELGITKASLHYHFPSKAELGESLITRYATRFAEALTEIAASDGNAADKLQAYCAIYRAVLADHRMCLCGMLAAEYEILPDPMRHVVVGFFDHNQAWLSTLLEGGRAAGTLRFAGTGDQAARSIIATLEGAMLVSRPYANTSVLDSVADRLIAEFSVEVTTG